MLRRLSKIHEELGRPAQAAECLQELKTLGGVNAADAKDLQRSVMHLNAKKRMEGNPHHFRMLGVATSAVVLFHLLIVLVTCCDRSASFFHETMY